MRLKESTYAFDTREEAQAHADKVTKGAYARVTDTTARVFAWLDEWHVTVSSYPCD